MLANRLMRQRAAIEIALTGLDGEGARQAAIDIASTHMTLHQWSEADTAAATLLARSSNEDFIVIARQVRAEVAARAGRIRDARRWYEQALPILARHDPARAKAARAAYAKLDQRRPL